MSENTNNINWEITEVYAELIKKLEAMEEGEITEFKTEVSPEMIVILKKRYLQLFLTKETRTGHNGLIGLA